MGAVLICLLIQWRISYFFILISLSSIFLSHNKFKELRFKGRTQMKKVRRCVSIIKSLHSIAFTYKVGALSSDTTKKQVKTTLQCISSFYGLPLLGKYPCLLKTVPQLYPYICSLKTSIKTGVIIKFPPTHRILQHCDISRLYFKSKDLTAATDRNRSGLSMALDEAICTGTLVYWISAL